jgi:hypothetical protein
MKYLSLENLRRVVLTRKQIDFNSKRGNIMIDELTNMISNDIKNDKITKNEQINDENTQNDDNFKGQKDIDDLDKEINDIKQNSEKIKIEKELVDKSYNDALNNFDIVYAKKISTKLKDLEDKIKTFDDDLKLKEQKLSTYKEKQLQKNKDDEITSTSEYQSFIKKFGE